MLTSVIFALLIGISHAQAMDVRFLTPSGSLPLKTWNEADLKKISKRNGEISSQTLIFDESAAKLELNDRAEIDLVTVTGDHVVRVPRFMIWRDYFKFHLAKDGTLNSSAVSNRLLVPKSLFTVTNITKIELGRAAGLYPEIELYMRTNPAASRGEKLFAQSCLACHGLSAGGLKVESLTDDALKGFAKPHRVFGIDLDAKAFRGLVAYRDALVLEHTEVKSGK